ncbi:transglycosylase domain-containing protein [Bacteroidetes bacterium endosymbiont of Geopemphigus sp.]|uniref:transglycosylase domain-containing protein n=1 Tax=Bacteroidetes bacterium endosymbiont of Geopemphigus sp. TaxID=2047937 RepID=UPI000CD2085E|nr:transglycosylase domain-containing protein [Bacteroidetes bacterium endosymbiont of Geopemphigus sp.]
MKKKSLSSPKIISNKFKKWSPWKIMRYFWITVLSTLLGLFILFYMTSKGWVGKMPSTEDIENPSMEVSSEVYDINKKLLGKFFSENRTLITYKQLPTNFVNALIAKEDIRFREHSGIDGRSLLRAILFLGQKGGASTISQQLAKLLFTGRSAKNKIQRLHQKLLEWVMAIELERRYSKEEIIAMYVNKFDFLNQAKGVESAARTYFNKGTENLNLQECATLVGMLENPRLYNPKMHPNTSKRQRNLVLLKMKKYHFIDAQEYQNSVKIPLSVNFKLQKHNFGLLNYYTGFLKKETQDALNEYEEKSGEKLNLYGSGLKVYTSIDARMQKYAEAAIKKHLSQMQKRFDAEQKKNPVAPFVDINPKKRDRIFFAAVRRTPDYQKFKEDEMTEEAIIEEFKKPRPLKIFTWEGSKDLLISPWDSIKYHKGIMQAGLISMEPTSGYVKAWVGGVDFDHFKYDHVAQTRRQVGSVFKPILYTAAINHLHYSPCTKISSEQFTAGNWSPRNSNGKYGGNLTLKQSLAFSVNTVSARLISQTTAKTVIDLSKEMGIESPIPNNLSIALGSADITPYEMTAAFNTFDNHGIYIKPRLLVKIEDKYGKIIKEMRPSAREVLNEETAFIMLKLMQGVVDFGTARRLRQYGIKAEIAGKTGTTNDQADGWFIGMVPRLTTGIWVGWEDRFAHFKTLDLGQGSSMALPIWAYYMGSIYEDVDLGYSQEERFQKPTNINFRWDDCDTNQYGGLPGNTSTNRDSSSEEDRHINQKHQIDYND